VTELHNAPGVAAVLRGPRPGAGQPASVDIVALRKSFGTRGAAAPVLKQVSLHVPSGKITSILGESGCGKTTLLRIVAGLERADSGQVIIDGRDVTEVEPSRREVAMVFQNYGLYPAKTVAKNIEFPLKMAGVPKTERAARAREVARLMHVEDYLDRLPAELSGGQRQRVGICRALVREPRIVLMDEPLSNLDARLRTEMRSELTALQRRLGSTMIYVTHDQVEAMTMSDQIVVMRAGRIEQLGTPLEVFARPATSYVAGFLGAMNLVDGRLADGRLAWDGGSARLGLPTPAAGRAVTLGVRPEQLRVTDPQRSDAADAAFALEGEVVLTELLGTDRIVHVRAGERVVRARVDAAQAIGARATVTARAEHLHLYDADTGERCD
jgi:ABC-type sugar transport system ATPase subunit